MNLTRCQIVGFGKLHDLNLEFSEGLNLVFAPNEGGKSTLQRCLVALLYGQLRSDLKFQRRLEAWVEQYKPWKGETYGGILWCCLRSRREFEIHRSFGKEETRVEIRTATGEEVTGEYEQQKNGEVLFARTHLELPKDLFESIAVIKENRLTELNNQDSIRDRITNLAQSGAEELSIRQSLDRLRQTLEDIGSDRAPTKPYMQAIEQLAALRAEGAELAARRAEFAEWVEERNRLAAEVARLDREQAAASRSALMARFLEAEGTVRALEDLDRELVSLCAEAEPLRMYADFPSQELEELNQLAGACSSLEKSIDELRVRFRTSEDQLRRLREERRQVEAYGSVDAEKISDWFVHYLSLTVKRDEAQKSLSLSLDERGAIERSLSQLGTALRDPDIDWQRRARDAAEEERSASGKNLELGEKISSLKARATQIGTRRSHRVQLGCILVLVALAPFAFRSLGYAKTVTLVPLLGFSAAFAAAALALFLAALMARSQLEQTQNQIKALVAEQGRVREQGQNTNREIQRTYQELGFASLEEFLDAAKHAEQCRQRLSDVTARAADVEQQRQRLQAECSEVFANIAEALGQAGLSCSPGNIKNQIDLMRSNVRRFRELDASWRNLGAQTASLQAEEARLTGDYKAKADRVRAILSAARVETPEEFRECCRKRQRALELIEKEASRGREFGRLCGGLTLEGWRQRAKDLKEALNEFTDAATVPPITAPSCAAGSGATQESSPYLPYLPGVEEAEQLERQLTAQLASLREEHARIVERVSQAFQGCRPLSEIEEDIGLAERRVRELSLNRDAVRAAFETLQALSREQQEVLAPQLNGSVEERFLRLCRSRYEEVRIDPEFHIYAREPNSGELRPLEYLSRGTQDQLYFALRFGILDLVSSQQEPCPCLLDEPFAAYDQERLIEAFRILQEEAKRRQLFVFTCREDLRDMAKSRGARVIALPDGERSTTTDAL